MFVFMTILIYTNLFVRICIVKRLKGYSAIGYRVLSKDTQTLFDNTDDLQTSSYEGQIFNGNTSVWHLCKI